MSKAFPLAYWLEKMEPDDRQLLETYMLERYKGCRTKFYSICEIIAETTPQWQTLPGGFWRWRNMHNKYAPGTARMAGIYEDDPWPSYNFTPITDERRQSTQGATRFSA